MNSDYDLFMILESLAIQYRLRLVISRASVGSGWSLYFRDDASNNSSRAIRIFPGKDDNVDIETMAEDLAKGFVDKLNSY